MVYCDMDIGDQAGAFLDALYEWMKAQNARITASGDPDAPKDHYVMMTLLGKLRALGNDFGHWQAYCEAATRLTAGYKKHLKQNGHYGAPIVGSAERFIGELLRRMAP